MRFEKWVRSVLAVDVLRVGNQQYLFSSESVVCVPVKKRARYQYIVGFVVALGICAAATCLAFNAPPAAAAATTVTDITGAGATFPYPVYAKWAESWQAQQNMRLNYQPVGSGGGIREIKQKTVDFGASDLPLSTNELTAAELVQFPAIIGGVVPVINLPNITTALKLTGSVLANIFLGKIIRWDDAAIKALNPDVALPDIAITVVHRSDGSGTTFLFTHYLGQENKSWQTKVGSSTAVSWPVGIGGKGNAGIAAFVQRIPGSIGYVEYAYGKQNNLTPIMLQNRAGQFVAPSLATFSAASENATWTAKNNFAEILTDEPGAQSWPITGASFILVPAQPTAPQKTKAVLQFFTWSWQHGADQARQLDYVPLPALAVQKIKADWQMTIKGLVLRKI